MTWTNLKTDYKNIDWDGLRKYQMIDNQDGTVSFLDVTEYINAEDANVLANGLNQNNDAVNRIMNGEYFYFEGEVDTLLGAKQNLLTFDDAPTSGSANPVKSGGIKTALDTISSRIDNLTVFSIYVCGNGEYNPTTGQPTIQNPDTSTFYLVPSSGSAPDIFTEWIYVNNAWELFGSGKVDLSNYVTQSDLQTALAGKEDTLTFDTTPTDNSDNPVTSGGIYTALAGKSNTGHDHDDRYYTETETDTLLAGKSSTGHDHDDRYYTESEMDTLLGGKRDVSDSYTKNEVDTLLSAKVDNTSVGAMAFVGDASSDGQAYGRKDGAWYDLDGRYYTEAEVDTALALKAPLASPALTGTPTAPTAAKGTNTTQIATTEYVTQHEPFKVSGTASAGNSFTITDSRIDSDHWKIPENGISFGTLSNVISNNVTWTTNTTNHTVTFSVTFVGSTTVTAEFHWYQ